MSVTAKAHPSLLLHVYTHFSFLHTHSLLPIPNLVFLLTPTHTHTLSLLCVLMMLEHCNTSNTSILSPSPRWLRAANASPADYRHVRLAGSICLATITVTFTHSSVYQDR